MKPKHGNQNMKSYHSVVSLDTFNSMLVLQLGKKEASYITIAYPTLLDMYNVGYIFLLSNELRGDAEDECNNILLL